MLSEALISMLGAGNVRTGELMKTHTTFRIGEKDIDFDELYRHADSAMYKSKNNTGYCATLECVTKTF